MLDRTEFVFEAAKIIGITAFPLVAIWIIYKLYRLKIPPIKDSSNRNDDGFYYFQGYQDGMNDEGN